MDDDQNPRPARRPSAMAMIAAGALGAAVLGVGGVAYAQTATPSAPGAAVTQEKECDKEDGGADDPTDGTQAPTADATSSAA